MGHTTVSNIPKDGSSLLGVKTQALTVGDRKLLNAADLTRAN